MAQILAFPKIILPEVLSYLKDMLVNILFMIVLGLRTRIYVGADGLNTLTGLVLRKLGYARTVVYYSIDYTPRRFDNRLMNAIYHAIDNLCVKRSDYVWNLSSRMADVRKRQGIGEERNLIVPVGVTLSGAEVDSYDQPRTMVFLSRLVRSKGMDLVLDALPQILSHIPDVRLIVIGAGPYEIRMKEIVRERNLSDHVAFLGPMNHNALLDLLPRFAIGLAPYPPWRDSITWYADPTKVKDYLACGLPVIITRVPEVYKEMKKSGAGTVIDYSSDALARAAVELLSDDDRLILAKHRALNLSHEYLWDKVYADAFDRTGI